MTFELSFNEKIVLKEVFVNNQITVSELQQKLDEKLQDKKGNRVKKLPDPRYLSKLKSEGLTKIKKSLESLARSMMLEFGEIKTYQDKVKGLINVFNFRLNADVYLIYMIEKGPVAWYLHESQSCRTCSPDKECDNILNLIIEERNLSLPKQLEKKPVDAKALWAFNTINNN